MSGPSEENAPKRADGGSATPAPRWVKVFGIVGLVVVAAFAIIHLTVGGLHEHGAPPRPKQSTGETGR